jgi:hypothetical protein
MFVRNIIKKVLREQSEEWVDITADDYIDLLKYVNGDGRIIRSFPDYKNKKIRIVGDLYLYRADWVSNIDSIDYVEGDLNIENTDISHFDKSKVKGSFRYHYSKMYEIERQKILKQKLDNQEELRQEGAWNVGNDNDISEETEAIYQYLTEIGVPETTEDSETGEETTEDKYFLYKENYRHYGNSNMYTWLGRDKFESEYVVYRDDKIHDAAMESLQGLIEEVGYDAFREWVWENNINEDEVRNFLYNEYEDVVRESPEDYGVEKLLSSQQEKYIEIYEQKMDKLNDRLQNEDLTEEQTEEIEDEISSIENIIEEIRENPEGDYSEDEIEGAIEGYVDNYADDFATYLKDRGFPKDYILDFIHLDGVAEDIIQSDGYGNVLNGYDGTDNEYKINGTWYHVMRYN